MSLAGSILGVVINITFPVVIQNICLFLIFGFVLWKSLVKGIQSYRLESQRRNCYYQRVNSND